MFGNIPPFYNSNPAGSPPATNTTTTAFTGGAWTFTKTAEAAAAETIVTFKVSDDATATAYVKNSSTTNARFSPVIGGLGASSAHTVTFQAENSNDSGTTPVGILNARKSTPAALTARPLWSVQNNGTEVSQWSAAGVFQINGGTAPGLKVGNTTVGIKQLFMASGTINPASVPANTTNTESFTVTGVATDMVITLNTSALPAGLGIVNVFPTGADTIDVTFMNNTGVAIDAGAVSYYLSGLQFI